MKENDLEQDLLFHLSALEATFIKSLKPLQTKRFRLFFETILSFDSLANQSSSV